MIVKNMYIIQSNHIRVCNCYCYCLLIMIRDRLASSEHREHTWKISMNRYGYARKEMDTLSGVRTYMVKMYLQVEMYIIFDDFTRINESGIKKTTCINFVSVQIMFV